MNKILICLKCPVSPHLSQPKRFCVMSFLTSSSIFPLLTSVQSHCLLKTPSCSRLRTFALAVQSRGLFPQFFPQLAPYPPLDLSSNVTSSDRPSQTTLPNSPTLLSLCGLIFFTNQHLNAHVHLFMFIVPLPRRSPPLGEVLFCLCSLLCPRVQVRAWHTLDANKHLLKEFTNGDQP